MLFNVISITALAAIAQAAPWPASSEVAAEYTPPSRGASSTAGSGMSNSVSTVTKTVSVCSTGLVGTGSGSRPQGTGSSTAPQKNLAADDAVAIAKKMHSEVTAVDRFKDLLAPNGTLLGQSDIQQRITFDFNNAAVAPNATGGRILVANDRNFPILTELGIAGAVAFLDPCSMNTPHTHPRATELLTLVSGRLETGMMLENGFFAPPNGQTTQISAELKPFQATVFPEGKSPHTRLYRTRLT